jgi:hypothetical protein
MRVLLAFLLLVTVGSIWESRTGRLPRAGMLLALSTFVAVIFFSVSRLV